MNSHQAAQADAPCARRASERNSEPFLLGDGESKERERERREMLKRKQTALDAWISNARNRRALSLNTGLMIVRVRVTLSFYLNRLHYDLKREANSLEMKWFLRIFFSAFRTTAVDGVPPKSLSEMHEKPMDD